MRELSGNDGRVKLWDLRTGAFIRELSKPCEVVWRIAFKDDKCVVLCKRGGKTVMEVRSRAFLSFLLFFCSLLFGIGG